MADRVLRGSAEERALFNPAFLAILAFEIARDYQKVDGRSVPVPLFYLGLPLALHRSTRSDLPRRVDAQMHTWIGENAQVLSALPRRLAGLTPFVSDALTLGTRHGILLPDSGALGPGKIRRRPAGVGFTQEVADCRRVSAFVGRWFAVQGDTATLLALWGFRP